uniref:Uncharacterized protein n=1 Tax=Cannabis sativa TaxID=3483 RepID=A0A803PSA9_CANSA
MLPRQMMPRVLPKNPKEQKQLGLQRVEMLETELYQTTEHREAIAKHWNESQSKLSQIKQEAKEQQRTVKTDFEGAPRRSKNSRRKQDYPSQS